MQRGVDIWNAIVMTFEVEAAWRDDALEILKGSPRDAVACRRAIAADVTDNVLLVFRRRTVGRERAAGPMHPWRVGRIGRLVARRKGRGGSLCCRQYETALKQKAAIQKTATCNRLQIIV